MLESKWEASSECYNSKVNRFLLFWCRLRPTVTCVLFADKLPAKPGNVLSSSTTHLRIIELMFYNTKILLCGFDQVCGHHINQWCVTSNKNMLWHSDKCLWQISFEYEVIHLFLLRMSVSPVHNRLGLHQDAFTNCSAKVLFLCTSSGEKSALHGPWICCGLHTPLLKKDNSN